MSAAEVKLLKRYLRANQALGGGLARLWACGALGAGLRGILPFVALFHFNRHGIDGARRLALARAMSDAWNPRRGMRGA